MGAVRVDGGLAAYRVERPALAGVGVGVVGCDGQVGNGIGKWPNAGECRMGGHWISPENGGCHLCVLVTFAFSLRSP